MWRAGCFHLRDRFAVLMFVTDKEDEAWRVRSHSKGALRAHALSVSPLWMGKQNLSEECWD